MSLRKQRILNELKEVMCDLGGLERDKITDQATFLELGFDSLFLAQMTTVYRRKFGVNVTFRQLLEEAPSPEALAGYLDSRLPPEEAPSSEPPSTEPQAAAIPAMPPLVSDLQRPVPAIKPTRLSSPSLHSFSAASPPSPRSRNGNPPKTAVFFESVISQQLQLMERQLEVLKSCRVPNQIQDEHRVVPGHPGNGHGLEAPLNGKAQEAPVQPLTASAAEAVPTEAARFGPWKPIDKSGSGSLSPEQRQYLDDLIFRYTARTQKSKHLTAAHRSHLADPRAVAGFRTEWKEMVYPIVSTRSSGSKLWDIDGNEYVDMIMGFGPALFGHSPDFVVRALEEQMKRGIEIGPQSPLVGDVARLVCDFTGMERATFCNTGSEAVLAALRVARTVTGRSKIALFAGSYHGIFDEVLVRPTPNGDRALPVAPGIPRHMVQDVLVLRYGDPESLDVVRKHGDELAAVLVEPVQSRHPDLQPREFLHSLRDLTATSGIALIFDEVITGFRLHSGGAQAWFGVQADLATYGKALGGGLPIGAVAGKARFMNALDGGPWNYGDSSMPEADVTYFAGTFVRHPLAMAAASAVLRHLKEAGPQLYQSLNEKASRLAKDLNRHFEGHGIPIHIQQCGSLFCISFTQETRFASLFFFYLREKGVHIWEGRPTFISTAHTDEDLALVARAMRESAAEMRRAGFFPPPGPGRKMTEHKTVNAPDTDQPPAACNPPGSDSMTPACASVAYPLTEAQMEIWLATQLGNDGSRAFNENILLQFRGSLDLDAMRLAVQKTIDRHEALRITFSHDGDSQKVAPSLVIDIPLIDLYQPEEQGRKSRFQDFISAEVQQPFELVKGPLVRAKIVRLTPDEHFLLLTAHHIVCDGWSIHVLLSDLSAFYESACNFKDADLPQPTPFREYGAWQLKQQNTPEGVATEKYWLDRFADLGTALKLPTDGPRPAVRTFNGSCERVQFANGFYASMKQFGASQGCTAFTTFLAAFKVLLFRLTAQEDIVVGIGVAGQSIMGVDPLVGHCVNTLPVRNRIDPNQSFIDFLKSVNRSFLEAYEHPNYTFGTLVKKLKFSRDPSQAPLISVMYNMDQELKGLSFGPLDFELCPDPNPYVNFDLSFNLCEKRGGLILECEYNRDLFDGATVRRWIGHYESLVREILLDPHQPISGLPLLSEAERNDLLIEWNRTKSPYPEDQCVHELFEAQASRSPEAVAVVFEDKHLTYGDLNQRANLLAHYLQALGVEPDVPVGICMERSLETVVALLAILKAGGAYLPLDPAYPQERLSFMLKDAKVAVLLTQQRLTKNLPEYGGQVFCLDPHWERLVKKRLDNPRGTTAPGNLACLIYTSGSTGQPKGVEVPHRGITRLLFGVDYAPLDSTQTFCHLAPLSFDASTFELWGALLHGAQCVLYPGTIPTPAELGSVLHQNKVSVLWLTTSFFNTVIDEAPEALSGVKQLLIGGEALSVKHVRRALELLPETQIVNCYGPTENTTFTCCYPIPRDFDQRCRSVPIGRPISNTQVYILDTHLKAVPVGVPGELYIGGDGLARGYLNRPELTAERFISNPFNHTGEGRLYKSGDLVCHRTDGNIEFLGRIDKQVKIRGFRIEPGEIEVLLSQYPGVRQTVVLSRENNHGDKRLVAYVVRDLEHDFTNRELRNFLKRHVPDFMVPSAFVFLDSLPITPNGKVDERALPDPRHEDMKECEYVEPRDETEGILCRVWSEVLGVDGVGLDDNFFAIGGHSLLAAKLLARLNDEFGRSFSLGVLFTAPTVRLLAECYRTPVDAKASSVSVPLTKGGTLWKRCRELASMIS